MGVRYCQSTQIVNLLCKDRLDMKIDVISTLKAVIEGSIEGAAAGFIL